MDKRSWHYSLSENGIVIERFIKLEDAIAFAEDATEGNSRKLVIESRDHYATYRVANGVTL